jgi:L-fuconolactonase
MIFLSGENFQRGIKAIAKYDYAYDILIYHHQLKPALEFVSKISGTKNGNRSLCKTGYKNKKHC